MAIRNIVKEGDETLAKVCRPVTEFNERLWQLLDDMRETLTEADGVGLAGPQVGILRRLFVMNVGDGWVEAINPEIILSEGEQTGVEGCLSCPGEYGMVTRPLKVRMKAQDRNGNWYFLTAEELKARCICHESDHLDGKIFKSKASRMLDPSELA